MARRQRVDQPHGSEFRVSDLVDASRNRGRNGFGRNVHRPFHLQNCGNALLPGRLRRRTTGGASTLDGVLAFQC